MRVKAHFISFVSALVVSLLAQSQTTFYSNGLVSIQSGAVVQVNGNVEIDGSNSGSLFENHGDLTVSNSNNAGDFYFDNQGNSAVVMGNGVFHVEGDWINDGNFVPQTSEVELFGSDQLITGSQNTIYNILTLTGTGIKRQTLDAFVNSNLNLNDRELATDSFTMYVLNSDPTAVSNSYLATDTGFVSSLNNGSLWWQTSQAAAYMFPLGSSLITKRYRPVMMEMTVAGSNAFGLRLANHIADNSGYDVEQHDDDICALNELYYHEITRTVGSDPVNLSMFYLNADGDYDAIGLWASPQSLVWNSTGVANSPVTMGVLSGFEVLSINGWNDFSQYPFILGQESPEGPEVVGQPEVCAFQASSFSVIPGDQNSTYFEWFVSNPNASLDSLMQGTDNMDVTWGGTGGTVSVVETFPNGCRSQPSNPGLTVSIYSGPNASFTSNVNDPNIDVIDFTDNSSSAFEWYWEFGDEDISIEQNPSHEYDEIGTYTVMLVAADENGCMDTVFQDVTVYEGLDLPQVFSPNGDGVNDVFVGVNAGVNEYELEIYNRWGELIFSSVGNKAEWTGHSFSGEECSPGTYFYVLTASGVSGDDYSRNGYVTLLR